MHVADRDERSATGRIGSKFSRNTSSGRSCRLILLLRDLVCEGRSRGREKDKNS